MQVLGAEVGDERHHHGDGGLGGRVVQRRERRPGEPPQREAEPDPDHHREQQLERRRAGRERAGDGCRDRDLVEHQRRGVVEHPLALEHRHHPRREPQPAGDRRRRDRVRRGHHRAEDPGGRPGQATGMGDDGHHRGRRDREPHREQQDRARTLAELPHGGALRGGEEQRRQQDRQDEVRVQRGLRHAGHERDAEPEDGQQHRLRDAQPVAHGRQHDDAHEQGAEQQQLTHGTSSSRARTGVPARLATAAGRRLVDVPDGPRRRPRPAVRRRPAGHQGPPSAGRSGCRPRPATAPGGTAPA